MQRPFVHIQAQGDRHLRGIETRNGQEAEIKLSRGSKLEWLLMPEQYDLRTLQSLICLTLQSRLLRARFDARTLEPNLYLASPRYAVFSVNFLSSMRGINVSSWPGYGCGELPCAQNRMGAAGPAGSLELFLLYTNAASCPVRITAIPD